MSDSEEEKNEDLSLLNEEVSAKYKAAAKIVNEVLKLLCQSAKVGTTPIELCELGDAKIAELTGKVYNKPAQKELARGVAFPTSVSVNEIVCHHSPLPENPVPLKAGDIVKFDLGVHIDGFPAVAAHTVVVQEGKAPITGRVADLVQAANLMMEVGTRCLREGNKNNDIPPLLEKIAAAYDVNLCEGVLSHNMKRYVLDGNKCILSKSSIERRVDEIVFEKGQVWTMDIVLTLGKGKLHEGDARCCIFKRNPEQQYMLKLKASKEAFREINARFQTFPFTIRALNSKTGRMGVNECLKHDLVIPYPVLCEKPGNDVVHFKKTVFVLDKTHVVAGLDLTQEFVSDKKCEDPEILELIQVPLSGGAKKPKQKAAKKKAKASAEPGDEEKEGEGDQAEKKEGEEVKKDEEPKADDA